SRFELSSSNFEFVSNFRYSDFGFTTHIDLLQCLEEQVAKLKRIVVVLQAQGTGRRDAGELRPLDHDFGIEDDRDAVSLHGDDETVPLAEWGVGLLLRHAGAAD